MWRTTLAICMLIASKVTTLFRKMWRTTLAICMLIASVDCNVVQPAISMTYYAGASFGLSEKYTQSITYTIKCRQRREIECCILQEQLPYVQCEPEPESIAPVVLTNNVDIFKWCDFSHEDSDYEETFDTEAECPSTRDEPEGESSSCNGTRRTHQDSSYGGDLVNTEDPMFEGNTEFEETTPKDVVTTYYTGNTQHTDENPPGQPDGPSLPFDDEETRLKWVNNECPHIQEGTGVDMDQTGYHLNDEPCVHRPTQYEHEEVDTRPHAQCPPCSEDSVNTEDPHIEKNTDRDETTPKQVVSKHNPRGHPEGSSGPPADENTHLKCVNNEHTHIQEGIIVDISRDNNGTHDNDGVSEDFSALDNEETIPKWLEPLPLGQRNDNKELPPERTLPRWGRLCPSITPRSVRRHDQCPSCSEVSVNTKDPLTERNTDRDETTPKHVVSKHNTDNPQNTCENPRGHHVGSSVPPHVKKTHLKCVNNEHTYIQEGIGVDIGRDNNGTRDKDGVPEDSSALDNEETIPTLLESLPRNDKKKRTSPERLVP